MAKTEQTVCPVCGTAGSGAQSCPSCGLEYAFISLFAGPESLAFRRSRIDSLNSSRMRELRLRFRTERMFSLEEKLLALRNVKENKLVLFTPYGQKKELANTVQCSASRSHEVYLYADGSVSATGNNSFGQAVVSDLKKIRFVLASGNATYAVGADGGVTVRGSSPFAGGLSLWKNITTLAAGDHHIVGLTASGQVLNMGDLLAPEIFRRPLGWKDVTQIACANDYAIALTAQGQVLFAGFPGAKQQRDVARWKNIVSIAADDMYAIGLTDQGTLLLSGESGFLDRGRSQAVKWSNVLALSASGGCIGAVSADGKLHLAGGYFAGKEDALNAETGADLRAMGL